MASDGKRIWFITGCSTGFGRELAKMVLDCGYRAVVTARDPAKAEAIIAAVESPNPPLRLLLGKAALKGARGKLEMLKKDFDAWEKTTVEADFPDA
jgi:NAD(P)-dependent dehydrogenase (short-subunit alcohol dehydrogenase family)